MGGRRCGHDGRCWRLVLLPATDVRQAWVGCRSGECPEMAGLRLAFCEVGARHVMTGTGATVYEYSNFSR